jgi:alkylhydroperoxidase family enzyme
MSRITPLTLSADLAERLAPVGAMLGFVPNSTLIMARHPALLAAFQQLAAAALGPGRVAPDLKIMIGHIASRSAGCLYCMAHTAHIAERRSVTADNIEALFSAAERAALSFAQAAAGVPNAVADADIAELKKHFDEDQIVEMLGVVALYGSLHRWNDSLATPLEEQPRGFAERHLTGSGWAVGKHGAHSP